MSPAPGGVPQAERGRDVDEVKAWFGRVWSPGDKIKVNRLGANEGAGEDCTPGVCLQPGLRA